MNENRQFETVGPSRKGGIRAMRLNLRIFKGLFSVVLFIFLGLGVLPGEVKTVYIPEKIQVEENATLEVKVKNLSEEEIFDTGFMLCVDDFIYYEQVRPSEIFKLDLNGNVLGRLKKPGEGPGEFTDAAGLREYQGNISFLDYYKMKFIVYSRDFNFLRETKLKLTYCDFFVNKKNEIVFYGKGSHNDYYFYVYSAYAVKPLRKFGKTPTTFADYKRKFDFDDVRNVLYLAEKDGIWASFKNRYDLRYYEKEKLAVEIKAPKGFFKGEENEMAGRKYVMYNERSCYLARSDNRLLYFYSKNKSFFCDIFDLDSYTLLRRIKFNRNYWYALTHWQGNVFYGAFPDRESEDEDIILYRIEIPDNRGKNKNNNR